MIEIPLKKRHTEVLKVYENKFYKESKDRNLVEVLSIIADRLTDIADELEKGRTENE